MRRRTNRSPTTLPTRRKPVALAIAARPAPSVPLRLIVLLAVALLLALVLPRLAGAAPLAAAPELQMGDGVAVVHVETPDDAPVLVEWGLAPNVSRVVRSSGTVHDIALTGLEPGRVYVYRVLVGGQVVTPPTPFRTAGAVKVPAASLSI